MKKETKYFQDVIITTMFQSAVGLVAFKNSNDGWIMVGFAIMMLMSVALFLNEIL